MGSRISEQFGFLLAADGLKKIDRTCNIGDGSRVENSAEHSWHVALMAMVLAEHSPEPISMGRVLELLIAHDLVEVYAGDTLIYDEDAVASQAEREALAAERLFGLLPKDQAAHFFDLCREFDGLLTPESRFARAIDALAPTWLHWGDHASPEPDGLTIQQILSRKTRLLKPFPALSQVLSNVIKSAADRGLISA